MFRNHDETWKKIFITTRRSFTVKEIALDKPLDDSVFQEPMTEGATVYDQTHQPPLYYKYKAHFTPQEWQKIVKDAEDQHKDETAQLQKEAKHIGKPAPNLPTGQWINSKPLTWADLRGKFVILKFWSVGCGPCYNDIDALSGTYGQSKADDKDDKKPKESPIVYIGIHAPGNSREEIDAVLKKYKLGAPICIDEKGKGKSAWGTFFGECDVNAMPTMIAVDEEGKILAYGHWLSEVLTKVAEHRAKKSGTN